jgi:hypothetical protein
MARRGRNVKIPGFSRYLGEVSQVIAQEAARNITTELIQEGPWYSGQFARNWAVRVGNVRIPATVEPENNKRERTARGNVVPPTIPSLRGTGKNKNVGYTIDNRTTYRRIAMDLEPGRVEGAKTLSAPRDWYRTYVEAGPLKGALAEAVAAASKDPKVRGFKGNKFIGPTGRIVNR